MAVVRIREAYGSEVFVEKEVLDRAIGIDYLVTELTKLAHEQGVKGNPVPEVNVCSNEGDEWEMFVLFTNGDEVEHLLGVYPS